MNLETLLHLRFFVPGVIINIIFFIMIHFKIIEPEYIKKFNIDVQKSGLPFFIITSYIWGAVYHFSKLQSLIFNTQNAEVIKNIKSKLLSFYQGQISREEAKKLQKSYDLMLIFYYLIDTNVGLEKKARRVHLNGLVWTTVLDTSKLSFISYIYIIFVYYLKGHLFLWPAIAFLLIAISFFCLSIHIKNKHVCYSNRQLEYIKNHCRKTLNKEIDKILGRVKRCHIQKKIKRLK
ncbi:hypothetical protein P0136_11995 [Lentisphaerota bacterium ZTH]|nr:hypothetical protein JYG24_10495 [Lentisphaerota bacterium]WET06079.1 hypothetical protein P0136_11995 [Lentisphaerota bacterium ZTH]